MSPSTSSTVGNAWNARAFARLLTSALTGYPFQTNSRITADPASPVAPVTRILPSVAPDIGMVLLPFSITSSFILWPPNRFTGLPPWAGAPGCAGTAAGGPLVAVAARQEQMVAAAADGPVVLAWRCWLAALTSLAMRACRRRPAPLATGIAVWCLVLSIAHVANAWALRRRGLLYRVRDVLRAAGALVCLG